MLWQNYNIISNRISAKCKGGQDAFEWRPEKLEKDMEEPNFYVPYDKDTNQTRKRLSQVLAFIYLNRQRRYKDAPTIMPIPTHNRQLKSICGTTSSVERLIAYMERIGLITIYDSTYRYKSNENRCRRYVYWVGNEQKIIDYCKEHDIPKFIIRNGIKSKHQIIDYDTFDQAEVRFGTDLFLLKPQNVSQADFENDLTIMLYRNYPGFEYHQELANQINETFYEEYPDFKIMFEPSFNWNSSKNAVTKIGIRATNRLCGAMGAEKEATLSEEERKHTLCRSDILNQFNLHYEYDVKSSVPKMTRSLYDGYWVGADWDAYKDMIYIIDSYEGSQTPPEAYQERRKLVKNILFTRSYFDSFQSIGASTRRAMAGREDKEWVDSSMELFYMAMERVCGQPLGSEIFYHESCVYMQVTATLLNMGYKVWQVYDCWYTDNPYNLKQDELNKMIDGIIEECFQNYTDKQLAA